MLSNSLVLVVPADASAAPKSAADLVKPEFKKIALAEPQTVPAGIYAREYLQKLGLWDAVKEKVVPTENVRAALAAVESGNVEVGIVYKTDSLISKKVKVAVEIPAAEGPKISYPIAVLKSSKQPDRAKKFAEYLAGPTPRSVFEKFGFTFGKVETRRRDRRSMADRLLHDRGFGAKHTFNSPTGGRGRLADRAPRVAGESGRGNSGNAAVVRAAGRDRTCVAHALQPTAVR